MNKKLVALAVGSAFALPLAAQAQTANVTLYGSLRLNLEFVNGRTCQNGIGGGAGTVGTITGGGQSTGGIACTNGAINTIPNQISNTTTNRVSSNSSRFGMRGTESLGGGLNAVFQIESNVQADTSNASSSGLASRETFAGLQGSWGRVVYGIMLMPQDDLHGIFGNVTTNLTGILATSSLWAYGGLNKNTGSFDARMPNSVRYDSPNFYGFTAAAQYATMDNSGALSTSGNSNAGSQAQNINHAYVFGANLIYSNGPLQLAVSGEFNNRVRNNYAVGGPNLRDYDWTIAGSYNFGTLFQGFGLQIGFVYEQTHYDVQAAPTLFNAGSGCLSSVTIGGVTTSGGGRCSLTRNFGGVSATIPLGGGKIYGFYGKATNGRGSAPDGTSVGYLTRGGDTGSQMAELSYAYALSPRTTVWVGYNKLINQCHASYTFSTNGYNIAVSPVPLSGLGTDPGNQFCSGQPGGGVFGITHNF